MDFKVVPTESCQGLSKSALRKKLGNLAITVVGRLSESGFGKDHVFRRSRDDNRYSMLTVAYQSGFERPGAFRPELLIELNCTSLARPSTPMNVGRLFDRLAEGEYLDPIILPCISLDEAYVEKLVSSPRRLAMDLSRHGGTLSDRWDDTLSATFTTCIAFALFVRRPYRMTQCLKGSLIESSPKMPETLPPNIRSSGKTIETRSPGPWRRPEPFQSFGISTKRSSPTWSIFGTKIFPHSTKRSSSFPKRLRLGCSFVPTITCPTLLGALSAKP